MLSNQRERRNGEEGAAKGGAEVHDRRVRPAEKKEKVRFERDLK